MPSNLGLIESLKEIGLQNAQIFSEKYWGFRETQKKQNKRIRHCSGPFFCFLNLNKVLYSYRVDYLGNEAVEFNQEEWDKMQFIVARCQRELQQLRANGHSTKENNREVLIRKKGELIEQWKEFLSWTRKLMRQEYKYTVAESNYMKSRILRLYHNILARNGDEQAGLFNYVKDYNSKCADRAVVGLGEVELYEGLLGNRDLLIDFLVIAFKRDIIVRKIIPKNGAESIESYLYYMIVLDEVLNLRSNFKTMLSDQIAVKMAFGIAIEKVFKELTARRLINFIASHPVFIETYKEELEKTLSYQKFLREKDEMDLEESAEMQQMERRYRKLVHRFYYRKAMELLFSGGFLTYNAFYKDVERLPLSVHWGDVSRWDEGIPGGFSVVEDFLAWLAGYILDSRAFIFLPVRLFFEFLLYIIDDEGLDEPMLYLGMVSLICLGLRGVVGFCGMCRSFFDVAILWLFAFWGIILVLLVFLRRWMK